MLTNSYHILRIYSIKIILILCSLCWQSYAQNTVGVITNTAEAYNGYTLFTNHTTTYLINNCGEVINQWECEYIDGKSVYLLEDGSILRCGFVENSNFSLPGIGGVIQKIDWDGTVLWEYTYSSEDYSQHHDVYPLPNGNVLILAVTKKTDSEAFQAGRDPLLLEENSLYNEQIIEVAPVGFDSGEIVWEWSAWDHLIQDFDSSKDNFGVVSEHPELLDINYLGVSIRASNWLHVNSIQYNETLDQIILSSRQLNEVYIIDHSTTTLEAAGHTGGLYGKGGDFLYRWGNPIAYGHGEEEDQQLFGQHTPHWIPEGLVDEGKILIYNNGNGRPELFSSVDIIEPFVDEFNNYIYEEGQAYGPEVAEWQYTDTPLTDLFSRIMSSAQRLPNGNTLICDSDSGYFFEIDADENKVWEYINPQKTSGSILSQGDVPESNLTFRATKYSPDYGAFEGKDLTPGLPIELNPNLENCSILNIEEEILDEVKLYPNPVKTSLYVETKDKLDEITIYDYTGKLIFKGYEKVLDFSGYSSGMYTISVKINGHILHQKVIKI
ncbi:aryl-sulfate sulfotransferase [Mangrovimonas sp. YM274]|uniref:aryl-sulfate sulfotransferase n=1 Tax=Mangrovimonas sp. YM274 TaxID=3070660 RepID=UPI0027DCB4F6|nr:aryl-sulfate sulfotransferase [Mangrovimonas sp. YM274]WMI69501.1 aryl-sulfate sulfotransferase [Mangrovimonas sp. YM274]